MQSKVKGRVAVIAGAIDEVGESIALRLAFDGARVALCDEDVGQLNGLAERITASGGEAAAFCVDLSDPQAIHACIDKIVTQYGRIDILVNNRPDSESRALRDLSAMDFTAAMSTSLCSNFYFLREVVPLMQKNNRGRVVSLSTIAYLGLPKNAETAAAKSGLFGLTRAIALEAARDNVTVNTVVRGDIATASFSEEQKAKISSGIPVKRIGTPADIAYAVGFFASDASDYVTGQTFFVCGGKSAYFSMSV